jgi:hypothetical protein
VTFHFESLNAVNERSLLETGTQDFDPELAHHGDLLRQGTRQEFII